jgi:selenocysteine lyase/cysteine desulfurase
MQNEFPNATDVCYLNTASEGLLPVRSLRSIQNAAAQKQKPQQLGDAQYFEMPARCRALLATMLHCSPSEIALVPSTTYGMSVMALSLPLNPGDQVLLVDRDFPSNNFAWEPLRSQGIHIRTAPFQPDSNQASRVLECITPATRVLSLSLVHFYTGLRYDLKLFSDVCREKNIYLIVDAIQAAGALEIDLQKTPVDAMCAAAHKWQISPSGTGFLYIRQNLLPSLKHTFSGWMHNKNATSFQNTDMFEYHPADSACRYELGTEPFILLSAYEQSLMLLLEAKIPYIEEHNNRLSTRMKDFFRELGWKLPDISNHSPFCALQPPEPYNSMHLLRALAQHEIYVAVRANYLRMTPHLYNNERDIDRFCEIFKTIL